MRSLKADLVLALATVACLFGLANLWAWARPPQSSGYRPGLFPPSALVVPPGDDEEFADLTLSDLLLGLAEMPTGRDVPPLTDAQVAALRGLAPRMRERLAAPKEDRAVETALTRILSRGHLLFFQKVRKRHLGRARDDAANLAAVEAHVAADPTTPR